MKRWQRALKKRRAERRKIVSLQGTVRHLEYSLEQEKKRYEQQERRYFQLFGYDVAMRREMMEPDQLCAAVTIYRHVLERLEDKKILIRDVAITLVEHLYKNR